MKVNINLPIICMILVSGCCGSDGGASKENDPAKIQPQSDSVKPASIANPVPLIASEPICVRRFNGFLISGACVDQAGSNSTLTVLMAKPGAVIHTHFDAQQPNKLGRYRFNCELKEKHQGVSLTTVTEQVTASEPVTLSESVFTLTLPAETTASQEIVCSSQMANHNGSLQAVSQQQLDQHRFSIVVR
jgi:hypothetical protein